MMKINVDTSLVKCTMISEEDSTSDVVVDMFVKAMLIEGYNIRSIINSMNDIVEKIEETLQNK